MQKFSLYQKTKIVLLRRIIYKYFFDAWQELCLEIMKKVKFSFLVANFQIAYCSSCTCLYIVILLCQGLYFGKSKFNWSKCHNSQPTCEKVSKTSLLITNFSQNQKKVIRIFLHMYTVLRFKNDIQCSIWRWVGIVWTVLHPNKFS